MAGKNSVPGLILSSSPFVRSAKAQFPFVKIAYYIWISIYIYLYCLLFLGIFLLKDNFDWPHAFLVANFGGSHLLLAAILGWAFALAKKRMAKLNRVTAPVLTSND